MEMINISPSRLNLFNECKRCFYEKEVLKIKQPSGPMSSLPRGIDRDLKEYYDQYRGSLPPEIQGKVPGVLFGADDDDYKKLSKWRVWQSRSFKYVDQDLQVTVAGAIDDCLVLEDGTMIPLDYKTKSSEPQTDGSEYYQLQLDCYMLFLSFLGYKTNDTAYLAYYYPAGVLENNSAINMSRGANWLFMCKPFMLNCSIERAKSTIAAAAECIRGSMPDFNPSCEFCNYAIKKGGSK